MYLLQLGMPKGGTILKLNKNSHIEETLNLKVYLMLLIKSMLITFKTSFILILLCFMIFITCTDITGKVLLRNKIFKPYITDIQVEAFFLNVIQNRDV